MSRDPQIFHGTPLTPRKALEAIGPGIMPASWTRPHPSVDWDWWHEDHDGVDDNRHGSAADRDACIAEIHEWKDDHE